MTSDGTQNSKPPRSRRLFILLAIAAVVLIVLGSIWLHSRNYESTDDAFIDGHIITVSPKISAIVKKVDVEDNAMVKSGDLLVELDDSDFQAAYLQAQGNVVAAEGKLKETAAQVDVNDALVAQANAELIVAQTNAQNAGRDYERWLGLDEKARSKQQMDNASAAREATAAQVVQARAKIVAAQAQVNFARMQLRTEQGNLQAMMGAMQEAKNNLDACSIRAESDGRVTRKTVESGMYIQVDQALLAIVPTDVWVTANFKETQLNRIQPGQSVEIEVDAYPDRTLHGKIESIQNGTGSRFSMLPPENATGNYVKVVQRVPTKIVLDPGQNDDLDHLLSPGMSVEPSVKVR